MPMNVEIEAKLKVGSHKSVEQNLPKLGARFLATLRQTDYYFDDSKSTFTRQDKCLRIRKQTHRNKNKYFLAYKGPKQKSNFKKRQELEIEVKDFIKTKTILEVLGYRQAIVVEKTRRLWKINSCHVALDKVKRLGNYVEIEGPDNKKIEILKNLLGLEKIIHIKQSYADLLLRKLSKGIQ